MICVGKQGFRVVYSQAKECECMVKKWLVSIGAVALAIPMTIALSSFGNVRADEAQDGSVAINEKNFPDEEFRKAVSAFDADGDKKLSSKEIEDAVEINVREKEVGDLTGLEYFTELRILEVTSTKITSLDVSKNTNLVELYCGSNGLKKIDISNNPLIEIFWCEDNAIRTLDLSKNTKLRVLGCVGNKLTKLDLSNNTDITGLQCGRNALKELDLSSVRKLMYCGCYANQLKSLDVSFMRDLVQLDVSGNQLTELKLGSHQGMENLLLNGNDLNVADIRKCPTLLREFDEYGIQNDELNGYFFCGTPFGGIEERIGGRKELDYNRTTGQIEPNETTAYVLLFTIDYKTNLLGYDIPELPGHPREPIKLDPPTFEDFVERLYSVALDRASDPEGKEFWVKQVVEEGKTGADCARFFLLDAPEFMERDLPVEDFVETLYQTFFDRESDEEGKAGWTEAIVSGQKTRAEVVNDFIESTEWCDVCATYGVRSGAKWHKATKASQNAIDFATRLYTCCLNRDPEEDGVKYWSLALTNGDQTGASAAQFFFEGEEFVGFNTPNGIYLSRLYTTFMDREPAMKEVEYWVGELKAGRQNRHSILVFFAQSPEFTEICKKYGMERGEIA